MRRLPLSIAVIGLLSIAFALPGLPDEAHARKRKRSKKSFKKLIRRAKAKARAKARRKGAKRTKGKARLERTTGKAKRLSKAAKIKLFAKLRRLRFSRRRIRRYRGRRTFLRSFKWRRLKWQRYLTRRDTSLRRVRGIARWRASQLKNLTVSALARVLFVLQVEAGREARTFLSKLRQVYHTRGGKKVALAGDVHELAKHYRELYKVPCRGKLTRNGATWPPHYDCSTVVKALATGPKPVIRLRRRPYLIRPPSDPDPKQKKITKDWGLAKKRQAILAKRDRDFLPRENLKRKPTKFCVKNRCYSEYRQVARAIYGRGIGEAALPVFCAPNRMGKGWDRTKVHCSARWLDTLGGWSPWKRDGSANDAPGNNVIPAYACFGSPHLLRAHMILPRGGAAGRSGFHCRRRVFRILSKKAEQNRADENQNIARMCAEMRQQVWGEKYSNINSEYQKWCRSDPGRVRQGLCLAKGAPGSGKDAPPLPFMQLSREELLYFYGHRQLYCRADRKGLTHFLYNKKWAKTFTCDVPRGLLEAGPFEEGVQTCAIIPYGGSDQVNRWQGMNKQALKARLHCWKFDRPTCEDLSRKIKKEDIHRSNVFDAYDALMQVRRTRTRDVWALYDLKDAEKLEDFERKFAFPDTSKDEGTFGVKKFCRFVGGLRQIQCGYNKKTIAQYYELHRKEPSEGCRNGVCVRGAYRRGYFCGLFASSELFGREPHWMCGIDVGVSGRRLLNGARAICVGGARARAFQSSKGDKGSLQCYERKFLWGETEKSEDVLRAFDWNHAVSAAAKAIRLWRDPWIYGNRHAYEELAGKHFKKYIEHVRKTRKVDRNLYNAYRSGRTRYYNARKTSLARIQRESDGDVRAMLHWARSIGHTLGHRTSMMKLLMRAREIPAVKSLHGLGVRVGKHMRVDYNMYGTGIRVTSLPDPDAKSTPVRNKEDSEEINAMLRAAKRGEAIADHKWYRALQDLITDDNIVRADPKILAVAVRIFRLVRILERARTVVLAAAKKYAAQIHYGARARLRGRQILSRLELHERARDTAIPWRYKGNVFCVRDPNSRIPGTGERAFVCGSSPLLIAGTIELNVDRGLRRKPGWNKGRSYREQIKIKHQVRNQVKMGWCYGGMRGRRLFGPYRPSRALLTSRINSPYEMEVPPRVIDWQRFFKNRRLRLGRGKGRTTARRAVGRLKFKRARRATPRRPTTTRRRATTRRRTGKRRAFGRLKFKRKGRRPTTRRRATRRKPLRKAKRTGFVRRKPARRAPARRVSYKLTWRAQLTSRINWLRCGDMRYSDAAWELGDPRPPRKSAGAPQTAKSVPKSVGGDSRARGKTAKIMSKVGGLIMKLIKFVLPKFAKAIERVKDMSHIAGKFYDTWLKKLVNLGKTQWEKAKKLIEKTKELVEQARAKIDEAKEKLKKVELRYAAAPPTAKAKLEPVKEAAKAALNTVKAAFKGKKLSLKNVFKQVGMARIIQGSGALLNKMLEDLIKRVMQRVVATIEPYARNLLSRGFKLVRSVLDPIAKSVISALAGIPFVGAGLAALGQVAYSLAMNALEDAAFDGLMGVVERILSKLVRKTITPVFKLAQKKLLELAYGACNKLAPGACPTGGGLKFSAMPPRDRWINRALACKGPPIFDEKLYREALAARRGIMNTAREMRRDVQKYAEDLADGYLARYGYTYKTWMAAFGPSADPVKRLAAMRRVRGIVGKLKRRVVDAKAKLKRAKGNADLEDPLSRL